MFLNVKNRVSNYALNVWIKQARIIYGVTYAMIIALIAIAVFKEWGNISTIVIISIAIILVVVNFVEVKIVIPLRYRYLSYELNNQHIFIYKGGLFKNKIIIPTEKVYYVNNKSGPLLEKYSLENIVIGTMAGEFTIPCIEKNEAKVLQENIIKICEIKNK